jgi:hypothetical protein
MCGVCRLIDDVLMYDIHGFMFIVILQVVNSIRSDPNATGMQSADHVASLTSAVSQHGRNRTTDSEA